jgi:hypothetical protein
MITGPCSAPSGCCWWGRRIDQYLYVSGTPVAEFTWSIFFLFFFAEAGLAVLHDRFGLPDLHSAGWYQRSPLTFSTLEMGATQVSKISAHLAIEI